MSAPQERPKEKKQWVKCLRTYWMLTVATGIWLLCIAWYQLHIPQHIIEQYYSKGLFRIIQKAVTLITGSIPFSLIIPMLGVGLFLFIFAWIALWAYRWRTLKHPHWKCLLWGPRWLYLLLPVIWLWFLVFWGIGYQRVPLETRLNLVPSDIKQEEIHQIENYLLEIIERDQPKQPTDANALRAIASIATAMRKIVLDWDGIAVHVPTRVKATPPGMLLMNGTSGMCVPLTLEPHVDGGLPDAAFVAVAAHELGHITGLCDEGETNLLGYAAGLTANYPYARYAIALRLYRTIMRRCNKEEYKLALQRLPEQAQKDLRLASEAAQRYRVNWLQQWSWRAYNHYLKAQGVPDGIRSYDRGTQLLVYAWRQNMITFDGAQQPASKH